MAVNVTRSAYGQSVYQDDFSFEGDEQHSVLWAKSLFRDPGPTISSPGRVLVVPHVP